MNYWCRVLLVSSLILAFACPALAQEPPGEAGQPAAEPSKDQLDEAQRRYQRAIELFNEGSYDASLLEFRRAYELAPTYKILYNIALVSVQSRDYAQALEYFERYLKEGGDEVPELRRKEVEREITRMLTRVAKLDVRANVAGAQVLVDDLAVAKTPLPRPLRVNAGKRKITVAAEGRLPATKVIELAGGDTRSVMFDLRSPESRGSAGRTPTGPSPDAGTRGDEKRGFPWLAWTVTGVLAAGAGVTGYIALDANNDLDDENGAALEPGSETRSEKRDRMDDLEAKRNRFAIAADILAGAALVAGGISLYLTLDSGGESRGRVGSASKQIRVGVGPAGAVLQGAF